MSQSILLDTYSGGPKTFASGTSMGALNVDAPVMKQVIDVASASVTYICEAVPGTATSAASWRVQRISVSGNVTTISYAGGGKFDQVADDRASLTY